MKRWLPGHQTPDPVAPAQPQHAQPDAYRVTPAANVQAQAVAQQQFAPAGPPPPQLIHVTAIPNGFASNGNLRLSLALSVRLAGGNTLAAYPNFRHWTATLAAGPVSATLVSSQGEYTATLRLPGLNPDLWEGMFADSTPVTVFQFQDRSQTTAKSVPVRQIVSSVKNVYQSVGMAYPRGVPPAAALRPVLVGFNPALTVVQRSAILQAVATAQPGVFDLNASQRAASPLAGATLRANELSAHRFALLGALAPAATNIGVARAASALQSSASPAAAHFYGNLETLSAHNLGITQRFQGYHDRATDYSLGSAPKPTPTPPVLDFHQMLTAIGSYPALQRALGLVWDIEVPPGFLPLAPDGSGRVGVTAKVTIPAAPPRSGDPALAIRADGWMNGTVIYGARTAYIRAGNVGDPGAQFVAAPRGTIVGGALALPESGFGLVQMDVDGALFKMIGAATSATTNDNAQPGLAAPRGAGLGLAQDGRWDTLRFNLQHVAQLNTDLQAGNQPSSSLYAEDLVRGYRFDVWDSQTRQWHSLHRRSELYRSPRSAAQLSYTDLEGFTQTATTRKTDDPATHYLPEILARWNGWSLSAPRPGTQLSRRADPARAVPADPATDPDYAPDPGLPLRTTFAATPGSLPKLRYGASYRMRARIVDIAGNGIPHNASVPDTAITPVAPEGTPYLRHEPVLAPAIVVRDLKDVTDPGSDVTSLVIRTFNADPSQDGLTSVSPTDRHIAPPRISTLMVEQHGLLDDASGKLRGDAATYAMLAARDAAQLNLRDKTTNAPVAPSAPPAQLASAVPIEPAPQLSVPYLPDPLARGAALTNLPGTDSNSLGWVGPLAGAVQAAGETLGQMATAPSPAPAGTTNITYAPLTGDSPRPGSVTLIDFGATPSWPNIPPFRLALAPGNVPPVWDPASRVLTVTLPQATTANVDVSSFVTPENLKLLAAWDWLREFADDHARKLVQDFHADPALSQLLDAHAAMVAEWVRSALEGGHHQMTPARALRLRHAVQQPIGRPRFVTLTATRAPGMTDAALVGDLRAHGASSARVDINATWTDFQDAPDTNAGYTVITGSAQVDELPLHDSTGYGVINAPGNPPRPVGQYAADPDRILFSAGQQPRHHFHDTRHHAVQYTAVATSRFRDDFTRSGQYLQPNGTLSSAPLDFTRTSETMVIHVPSSARPAAPRVRYVLPTFGWERQTSTNIKVSLRHGKGLRVYLDGPWFSSGEGELLGVALYSGPASSDTPHVSPGLLAGVTRASSEERFLASSAAPAQRSAPQPSFEKMQGIANVGAAKDVNILKNIGGFNLGPQITDADRERLKPYITQWGVDPIWISSGMDSLPTLASFPDKVAGADGLRIPEARATLAVAGHAVGYDRARRLWYCDLTVDTGDTYTPFVRLALARYQPYSIAGMELSHVVLCDCVQLAPDRAAIMTADPYHPRSLTVTVSGPTPTQPRRTYVDVSVQQRIAGMRSDLAWEATPAAVAQVARDETALPDQASGATAWHGTITFARDIAPGQFRLVVQEYEIVDSDESDQQPVSVRAAPSVGVAGAVAGGQHDVLAAMEDIAPTASRLIYADIIELNPTTTGEFAPSAGMGRGGLSGGGTERR